MAAVTLLGSATFTTANGTKTVTATPAVDDLIILVCAHTGNTSGTAPTDNQSGTYTQITSAVKNASADRLSLWVRTALIPAASSTIFTHAPGTTTGGGLAVLKVTGMTRVGSNAIRQSQFQDLGSAGGTPTCVLTSAALTTNALVGAVFNATSPATMTPRASWTERVDVGYSTPTSGLEAMSRDSGETASSIAWGGTSASAFCAAVAELDTTPAPQTLTPNLFTNSQTFYSPTVSNLNTIVPSLYTNSQVFYAPTAVNLNTITPNLYTNSQTFYSPTISVGAVNIAPDLFTNSQTFYSSTVSNLNTLTPDLFTNSQTFYSPTVSQDGGTQNLSPSLFTNINVFYGPTIETDNFLFPSLFTNMNEFYGPTVSQAIPPITPSLFINTNIFYSPTVFDPFGNRPSRSFGQPMWPKGYRLRKLGRR